MHSRAGEERFNLEIAPELGTLRVDPVKLAQLLVILLDNAVKFSPPESPIDIEASVYDGDLLVSVKDRGSGIPMTETRKVFERFYQLEDALHHSSQGIGLGLYIAKKIVEAHGGEIWCELREGGGSVFSFILP
jgi:two-component system sensor histidine kinase KdpD